jgi:hypothetical protein
MLKSCVYLLKPATTFILVSAAAAGSSNKSNKAPATDAPITRQDCHSN